MTIQARSGGPFLCPFPERRTTHEAHDELHQEAAKTLCGSAGPFVFFLLQTRTVTVICPQEVAHA
jgi:hypothetical protein